MPKHYDYDPRKENMGMRKKKKRRKNSAMHTSVREATRKGLGSGY